MEAVGRTSTELRLELKGSRRLRLAAVGFLVSGLLLVFLLGWRTRLLCFPWEEGLSPAQALRDGWCVVRRENLWMWSERSVQMANIRAAILDGSGLASRVTLLLAPKQKRPSRPPMVTFSQTSGETRNVYPRYDGPQHDQDSRDERSDEPSEGLSDQRISTEDTTQSSSLKTLAEDAQASSRRVLRAPGDDDSLQELPLTHYYSFTNYATKIRIVRRINDLIARDWNVEEAEKMGNEVGKIRFVLDEEIDDRWFAYGCGSLFVGVFLALLFFTKREICIIDKNQNVLAIIRRNMWSRHEEVYQCQDVGLVEIHRATQNRKTEINVFLNIEPYSSWVPLSEHGTYASEEEAEEICSEIREFMGIESWQSLLQLKKLS